MYDLRAERELATAQSWRALFDQTPMHSSLYFLFLRSRLYLVLNKHLVSVR